MRKKLICYLSMLFVLFSIGVGLNILNTYRVSKNLETVIDLHRVEIVRQNLVINAQTVQGDLYVTGTAFGKELDEIVDNVMSLDEAARSCLDCHHNKEMTAKLTRIVDTTEKYKEAISYLITTTANEQRIKRLKMVAIGIGDTLLAKTQEMALIADKSLNARTVGALKEINNSMFILIATIILALFIGLLISVRLTEGITKPISELVNATRIIESGELGYTISYQDDTEFGELARNFNRMSIALKEGYENIYRQQQMIQESEWKFRTLSEFTNDWEYWIDGHRKIVFMSASCERITGYSPEEFSESPRLLYDIVHDEDRAAYETHMADFTATRHEEMEFRIITKSGQLKWISHVCGPIYVEERFLGRRVSNRDITDRKKLEEQLSQSQKMESLGLLAGGIAHDFNNLLTSITGYSSLLESELGDGDARTKRFVSQILSASERAQNLTSSLLAFSRKQIMKPSMVSLNGVVENISGLLRSLIGEDIELIISCSAEEFPIFADPHQIEQVIMNLVTNARDAMPTGGRLAIGTTPVTLSSEFAGKYGAKPGRYMVLSVSDTGMGIEAKDLPHIFDPFFTTKEKNKGTGLGLAMVYGVIKQHGGFIDVYTEKGWGTTFKIYQPASAEDRSDGQTVRAVPETAIDFRGNETIFIAEDDGAVREFMRDVLERYGYKVLMALDGVDAIRKYTEYKDSIDMVILDVVMPRKNGKEVYDHIKSMSPGLKALFMSGYTQDILTSRGIYEENLEFISKPLEINTLMLKVRNILSSSAHGP